MKLVDETMDAVGETFAPFVAVMFIVLHMFMILVSCAMTVHANGFFAAWRSWMMIWVSNVAVCSILD